MASLFVPYAILPSNHVDNDVDVDDNTSNIDRSILSLFDNQRYEWKNMFEGHVNAWCVGSSNGWLVLLDTDGFPLLLDPSSATCIHLPPLPHSFMYGGRVKYSYYVEFLRKTFVSKAVLMCSPTPSHYMLAIMYGLPCKLAFCMSSTWFELSDANNDYCDIVFNNNILYALAEDGSLEGWDFRQQNPIKILYIKPTLDIDAEEERDFPKEKFSAHYYSVISKGEFLLVKRYIGDFINADGEVVYEGSDDDGAICPYRTKHFVVYKLDFINNKWEKNRSLHDQALFLGANESTSMSSQAFPGCQANSIYFTDDRWQEMSLDYSYGGHDWGVFSLQDSSVKLLTPFTNKMDPPPVWVVPTSNFT